MRIALGGFYHETNAFGPVRADVEGLARVTKHGEDIITIYGRSRSYCSGYITAARELNVELVPTRIAYVTPSGITYREAFEQFRDGLVADLVAAHREQPLDGMMIHFHGAGLAEGYPDLEGEILRAIRAEFGPDIPIASAIDLHGNISNEMVERIDFLAGVKGYPHVDEYDQAYFAMYRLHEMVETGFRPAKKLIKLPWHIAPSAGLTTSGPAHDIQQFLLTREAEDDNLIRATFFHGFPYSDVTVASASVLVMAKTQEAADAHALDIARYAWGKRKEFLIPIYSAEQAVDLALAYEDKGPVVINEASDNPGGGAPADGTHLLRELLRRDVPSAFGFIHDPEVAKQAAAAGVGARINCSLGGKLHPLHGEPIELKDAYVKCVSDGIFMTKSPMGFGGHRNMGPAVCLVVGNVSIVVGCGSRSQTMDDGPFIVAGVDWSRQRIVAFKSAQHFKAWWADKVEHIVACNSPGIHSSDLTTIPFEHADTSFFPLQDAVWEG